MNGMDRSVDRLVIHPLTIGFFFSNLSPMIPAARFEVKPKTVKISAFSNAYCDLKPGYDLRKKSGKKLAMAASAK